jgi:hypothetical protein
MGKIKFRTKGGNMIVQIEDGKLIIQSGYETEIYALRQWIKEFQSPIVVKLCRGEDKRVPTEIIKSDKVEWQEK